MKSGNILTKIFSITVLMLLIFSVAAPSLTDDYKAQALDLPSPNIDGTFPSIHIDIKMEDILYADWQTVSVTVDNTAEEYQFADVAAEIRGRGNSTWQLEKKPFRIRFKESRSMLDAGHSARTWTFLADHSDKSLMRNYSAYRLASRLDGMSVAPYGRHVNVYLGDEYQGVYLMSIQVSEIAPGRVDLSYSPEPSLCEYLIEMDDRAPNGGTEGVDYVTVGGNHYAISYPGGDNLTPAHVRYVRNYLTRVDNAIESRDPAVFPLIDMPSFIDYYIVQELYKNADIGFSSVFMQIKGQGASRRLEMGPVWDFDVSAGNSSHINYLPQGLYAAVQNSWYRGLSDMPEFFDALVVRWNDVKDVQIRNTIDNIKSMESIYRASYQRNFYSRWRIFNQVILYNTREMMSAKSHASQVSYLTNFLETRKTWLDRYFNSTEPGLMDLRATASSGWVRWGTDWYYLNSKGLKETGWLAQDDQWYFLNPKGVMVTGWLYDNDGWYYLRSDGTLVQNETLSVDGTQFSFNANGRWVPDLTDSDSVDSDTGGVNDDDITAAINTSGR